MTKTKSSLKKRTLLDEYISKTHKEINENASKTLKSFSKDGDMISIDDSIHSVLIVWANDILNGNHETAVGMAASYKIAGITTKSVQCGEIPPLNFMDIGKAIPIAQSLFASLPLINSAIGSYIECIGKNMNAQCNESSFNYGVAMNIGANFANSSKASTLRIIGINIGNIMQCIDKEENYKTVNELIRQLPNNKYRKRLSEYVKSIYLEHTSISDSLNPPISPQTKPHHINTNHVTSNHDKTKSSLKKNKATKQKESDTINIGITSTKEDFEKAIKEISEKIPETSVTFCTEDDTEIANKNKKQKSKIVPKETATDEIKFATSGDE